MDPHEFSIRRKERVFALCIRHPATQGQELLGSGESILGRNNTGKDGVRKTRPQIRN